MDDEDDSDELRETVCEEVSDGPLEKFIALDKLLLSVVPALSLSVAVRSF